MLRIKYFSALRKMPILCFWRGCIRRWPDEIFFWLLTRAENNFESSQTRFYSNLDRLFQLPEFQTKLFLVRNWVGGSWRDSLLKLKVQLPVGVSTIHLPPACFWQLATSKPPVNRPVPRPYVRPGLDGAPFGFKVASVAWFWVQPESRQKPGRHMFAKSPIDNELQ